MPEQELSDVFVRAVGDSVPDLGLLIAGATVQGRGIRRRRRLARTGAVAAVVLLAVGGGLLLRPAAAPPAASPAAAPALRPGSAVVAALPAAAREIVIKTVQKTVPPEYGQDDRWEVTSTELGNPPKTAPANAPGISFLFRLHGASGAEVGTVELLVQRSSLSPGLPAMDYDCDRHPATDGCDSDSKGASDFEAVTVTLPAADGRPVSYRADLLDHNGFRILVTSTGLTGGLPPVSRATVGELALELRLNLFPPRPPPGRPGGTNS
ncbi:hypothetical protein ACFQ2M_15195 [Kitasatospora saccharophila]|uniref:hypothetical protein n=1 Tax=Kitasatospora saccharophila TaxID=407973 RepID=UPI0036366DAB